MQMRLCTRCNRWGETSEPCTCTDDLIEADQDISELKEINGCLQYQNDRLAAKTRKLELAEKMAREARTQMVEAEQRAEQAERDAVRECAAIAGESGPVGELIADEYCNRWPAYFKEQNNEEGQAVKL